MRNSRGQTRWGNSSRRPNRCFIEPLEQRVQLSASVISSVANFGTNTTGMYPSSPVIADGSGNLYGTTKNGGASGVGIIYEIVKGSGVATKLASFNITNGANPSGSLVMDAAGNLYGTAAGGGADNQGVVFELPKGSSTLTTIASFNGGNGCYPQAGLTIDASGNLYGTTTSSGSNSSNQGIVFEVPHGGNTIFVLAAPNIVGNSGVAVDGAGNLYGTTDNSFGNTADSVFEIVKGMGWSPI